MVGVSARFPAGLQLYSDRAARVDAAKASGAKAVAQAMSPEAEHMLEPAAEAVRVDAMEEGARRPRHQPSWRISPHIFGSLAEEGSEETQRYTIVDCLY
jgi:hypothetical protein